MTVPDTVIDLGSESNAIVVFPAGLCIFPQDCASRPS